MNIERWVHPADRVIIGPVKSAVFDRGDLGIIGTNLRVGDLVARFIDGEGIGLIAAEMDLTTAQVEAAVRTALRARKHWP